MLGSLLLCVRRGLVPSVVVLLLPLKTSAQSVIHPTKENIPISSDPRFELGHDGYSNGRC